MERCEARIGGICAAPATWKQSVHASQRDTGAFLMYAYWCDDHANKIVLKRKSEWQAPPQMAPLVATEGTTDG